MPPELKDALSPWERVQLARHPQRPYTLDYLQLAFGDFVELRGDRLFADDPAIVGGLADLDGRSVMVIGHQKGRDTRSNLLRRFGMARPEGYRKATRLMRQAERLGLPVLTFIDIPGADPSLAAEQGGQAFAIAETLLTLSQLRVPVVASIIGEGGSGGALALGLADRVLMLEHAIYSVASPEAAASILWQDGTRGPEAAEALQLTSLDLQRFGLIDVLVLEPPGCAHTDHAATANSLRAVLLAQLADLDRLSIETLVTARAARYRAIGAVLG